jgi:hypothetical protein
LPWPLSPNAIAQNSMSLRLCESSEWVYALALSAAASCQAWRHLARVILL